jgi:hypothetical protein
MPRVVIDYDPLPLDGGRQLAADSSDLVYFLSWAFSQRYGANHELSIAALLLRGEYKIDLSPLLTFADRAVEDPADAEALDRAWQDPGPLAETCRSVAAALAGGERRLADLQEDYPRLRSNIDELAVIATSAKESGARVRVTYVLEE